MRDSFFLKILVIGVVIVLAAAFSLLLSHIVQLLFQTFSRRPNSSFLLSNLILGNDQRLEGEEEEEERQEEGRRGRRGGEIGEEE